MFFHELGHADWQDRTGLTDGQRGEKVKQNHYDIYRLYDLPYTGHLRKPSIFPRFLAPLKNKIILSNVVASSEITLFNHL